MKTISINNSIKNSLTVSLISSVLFLASCKKDELINLNPAKVKGTETARQALPIKENWEPPIAEVMQSANQQRQALPVKHDLILHIPVAHIRPDAASQRQGGHLADASISYPVASLLPSENNARQALPIYGSTDPGFPVTDVKPTAVSSRLAKSLYMDEMNSERLAKSLYMDEMNTAKAIYHNEIQPAHPVVISSTK
ncbi:MAG: hypothetical protein ABIT08_05405 [Bacteroidia bacterium]